MALRSTTNLVVDANLQLPKSELRRSFLYLYNKGYTGKEPLFVNRLWLGSLIPEISNHPAYGKNAKGLRAWSDWFEKSVPAGLLTLQKVNSDDPHFVASLPLVSYTAYGVGQLTRNFAQWFTSDPELDLSSRMDALESASDLVIPGPQALKNSGLDSKAQGELGQSLIQLRVSSKSGSNVVFADFKISAAVAQQLTTTEWRMMRAIDLYPLLLQWVAGGFGFKSEAPLTSFPVSKIARTLPKTSDDQIRVNAEGLSVDPNGNPMWLPRELDNTSRYEDLFTQSGTQPDGSFALVGEDQTKEMDVSKPLVLTANIPVIIDWTNYRYAYTETTGNLKVQNISRFKKAEPAHIVNMLKRNTLTLKQLSAFVSIASYLGMQPQIQFKNEEINALVSLDGVLARKWGTGPLDIGEYYDAAVDLYKRQTGKDPSMFDFDDDELGVIFRPLLRFLKKARDLMVTNIDAVNVRYSVSGTSTNLGLLTLLSYVGNDSIIQQAAQATAAAVNQAVTEGWKPPSIPLTSDSGFGLLPHQQKVRNLLKDSPDFAILPVQAGGGKSVLTVTDVLYEIKADRSKPYLILCPGHLVAQYVKEIVYFTGSKLNVVPINTNSIFRNGFKRLTEMLEHAPRNTVVVADYDVLRARQRKVCYGTTTIPVYPVIEFLRQFGFQYAMLDESHSIKNDSQRTRACMALITDIPKKRLASGTMAHDSPSDLAIQIAALDPTLFGSRTEFNEAFGDVIKGDRVMKWKPGAQQKIMKAIKSRVVVAGAMRKEWAALLPQAEEKFFGVELTENQRSVYQAILTEALDKMKEDAKTNKSLQKFFGSTPGAKGEGDDSEEDDGEDAADENGNADLESLLGFYLARLEQFITAPTKDELGDRLLQGDDRISPKVLEIYKRCRVHLDANLPGKVLIFTNYTDSAEEIYDNMPQDLKVQCLLYKASEKVETGAAFEKDPRYKIMVGVENSMNTGLNFQHVSRLIRVETVWNPGTLEQGNSRVNRPELKQTEARAQIFYDWIVANNTLDVTKISRLISKVIAVAKFENTDSPAYESIPDVDVIPMNAASIQDMNSWQQNLGPYFQAYQSYKSVQKVDYAEYRAKHGTLKLEAVVKAPTPKDAMLMAQVPYTPGLELFDAGKLGLVRVDEYLRIDTNNAVEEEEEDEDEGNNLTPKQKERQRQAEALVGQPIHTEFGDGIIKSIRTKDKKVNVVLESGYMVRVSMAASFVKTKPLKNARAAVLKSIGDLPVTEKPKTLSSIFRPDKAGLRRAEKERELEERRKAQEKVKAEISVELHLNVSNGFLGLVYYTENDEAKDALQALNFRPVPQFLMARMKTAKHLKQTFDAWKDKGFTLAEDYRKLGVANAIFDMYQVMKSGGLEEGKINFQFSTRNNLINFFKQEAKPTAAKKEIKPYPMIEDGVAYLVMHTRGQPGNVNAAKIKVPGVTWEHGSDSMVFYSLGLKETAAKIKEIQATGIQVANIEDLRERFRDLKASKQKVRKEL